MASMVSIMMSILEQDGKRKSGSWRGASAAIWLCAAALLAMGGGRALAQPVNDFFTNATTLVGFSGAVAGDNILATVEPNEPQPGLPFGGVPASSVWYRWVAPADGIAVFDTLASANQLDTVLLAYDGTNLLTAVQVAINDDFPAPLIGVPSLISWFAQAGREYRIEVAGWSPGVGSPFVVEGPFVLTWNLPIPPPPPPAPTNQFQFEFATYQVGEGVPGYATITVIFGGGAPGAVSVDYATSDGTATESVDYIGRSGTLIFQFGESNKSFTVPILDNPSPNPDRTVNLELSNPTGGATLGPVSTAVLTIVDDESVPPVNVSGRFQFSSGGYLGTQFEVIPYGGGPSPFSERHNTRGVMVTVNRVGGTVGRVLVDYRTITNALLTSGIQGVDYFETRGTLVFDHLQTSTNFVVPVFGDFTLNGDRTVLVELSNPRPAPEENPQIIRPALGTLTNALLTIDEVAPVAAFTFERANFRGVEYGRPYRSGAQPRIGVEILFPFNPHTTIMVDLVLPNVYGAFNFGGRPLSAGADNADLTNGLPKLTIAGPGGTNTTILPFPNPDYSDNSTVITNFPDLNSGMVPLTVVGASFTFPNANNGDFQTIRLTLPASSDRITVFLPVVPDDVVEFNEDVVLRLDPIPGQPPVHPTGRFATMTILMEDMPSGAADREWNPAEAWRFDDVFDEPNETPDPPFYQTPGANNTVNGVAVDEQGRAVIGGDFTAFNSVPRNGIARLLTNGLIDVSFDPGLGADGFVSDVGIYGPTVSNAFLRGKIVIVGAFTSFNGIQRNGICRLNTNGTLDATFAPGAGVAGVVRSVALQSDGKILIGGDFTHYDGIERINVARINIDGSLDTTFDPGVGPNGTVWSVALLETSPPLLTGAGTAGGPAEDINAIDTGGRQGTITVTANFYQVPDQMRIYYEGQRIFDTGLIGSPDGVTPFTTNFSVNFGPGQSTVVTIIMNEGSGLFGTIWDYTASIITVGSDKKLMIGGEFTSVGGVGINRIARLNSSGSLDLNFNPGGGVNGPVYAVGVQGDSKIVVGGSFDTVDFRSRNSIARFLPSGVLDTAYEPGSGFDDAVFSLLVTSDGKTLCGGPFTSFNGTRRIGMARLFDHGALDTSFLDTAYNQFAGLIHGLSFESRSFVNDFAIEPTGNLIIGGSFTNLGGHHHVPLNETNAFTVTNVPALFLTTVITNVVAGADVTLTNMGPGSRFGEILTWTRQEKVTRYNVARIIGGRTPGPGNVEFTFPAYTADENIDELRVTMSRVDGRLGTLRGNLTTSNRLAQSGFDYVQTRATPFWPEDAYVAPYSIGYVEVFYAILPITDDLFVEGNEVLDLLLQNPSGDITLGGEFIPLGGARSSVIAPVTITDNDFNKGTIAFSHAAYRVTEDGTNALITLVRTNGTDGAVTVDYSLLSGSAIAGLDFTNLTARTITFGQGVSNRTIEVRILTDVLVEIDETLTVVLTNATSGARIGSGLPTSTVSATVTIIDNDFSSGRLNFTLADYITNETAGAAVISVSRAGGSTGPLSVQVAATSGSAIAGVDFIPVTNTLQWVNSDLTPKTFIVPLIADGFVEADETVNLRLFNPSVSNTLGGVSTAVLTIVNEDFYGTFSFSQPLYEANENGTNATITVSRLGGVAGVVSVGYQVRNGTAVNGFDYLATDGVLTFAPGEVSRTFQVTLLDNAFPDGDRTVLLRLTNFSFGTAGPLTMATLRIVDDESFNTPAGSLDTTFDPLAGADNAVYALALQPDGNILLGGDFRSVNRVTRNRMARLLPSGLLDPTFNAGIGPNRPVRAMALQPDGRILIGGFFNLVHGTNRNYFARLLSDGSVDTFFNPGSAANNSVYAIALLPDGRVVIGGDFTAYNGFPRAHVAIVNTNGSLNTVFNPGTGADGTVFAVAVQNDGKVLIGGAFTNVGGMFRPRLARLNANGTVDTTFNPGLGPNDIVRAITVQPDGRILIGGSFTLFNGEPWNYIARVLPNGAIDSNFLGLELGANGAVYDIKLQADGKMVVVGDFTIFNEVTRRRITRLDQSGYTDPSINFGEGANSFIATALIQPDRKIVIGGGFTEVQGQRRDRIARLHGGSIAGPGSLRFSRPVYLADESAGAATIVVSRDGGTTDDVTVDYATIAQSATPGLDYTNITGTLFFPEGEVQQTITIPLVNDVLIESDETVGLVLSNPGNGASLGDVPEATLIIQSDDSAVAFLTATFNANENDVARHAVITVVRTGTTNASVSVDYLTRPSPFPAPFGVALDETAPDLPSVQNDGPDYTNVTDTLTFAPGETVKTFFVPIVNDADPETVETVLLALTNVTGTAQLGISAATLLLADDDFSLGSLQFSAAEYSVNEFETNAVITVTRSNGFNGVVSVRVFTVAGTARAGEDFVQTDVTLTFADNEAVKTFNIPIVPDHLAETNESVTILMDPPTGGATLGTPNNARLTIINNHLVNGAVSFVLTNYTFFENTLLAQVSVARSFGSNGPVSVSVRTVPGTASNIFDYLDTTNTLVWAHGDTAPKIFTVTLLDDALVEGDETFGVQLFNPTGGAILGARPSSLVTIRDEDVGPGLLGFSAATYAVDESATNAVITITRRFGRTGTVSVQLNTVSGGTAVPGVDYQPVSVVVTFLDGETNKTVLVPVSNNFIVEGNRTVNLSLSAPGGGASTNGQIIAAVLTIVEDEQQAGSVDAGFGGLGPDAPVNVIVIQTNNNKLWVGGDFTSFNGVPRNHLVRLNQSGSVDTTFDAGTLLSNSVRALAVQPDGKILVGGLFTNINNNRISYLARLSPDGNQDTNFLSSLSGVDNAVDAIALQSDNRIVIGGSFTTVNGVSRGRVARLEADGTLDLSFNPGVGANGDVRALAIQADGKVVIAGDFTMVGGVPRAGIARLDANGTVDGTFSPGGGFNDSVRAVAIQPGDGRILAAGYFTGFDGAFRPRIARLNANGTLDPTFDPGAGADEYINALALQPDGKVVAVGGFTTFNGANRSRIVRLNPDGSVDYTINLGTGADNYVSTVALQTDRKIVIGGGFRSFDGVPRNFIARLAGGDNYGSGEFAFSTAGYSVLENGTNLVVTVERRIGSSNFTSVAYSTADGTALAFVHYVPVSGTLFFGPGETRATFTVQVLDDIGTNANRMFSVVLSNPQGGARLGAPAQSAVTIINDDSALGFSASFYSAAENQGSNVVITITRSGSTVGSVVVDFRTGTAGTATPGLDYLPQIAQILFTNGQSIATVTVPVVDDLLVEPNETVDLQLLNQAATYPAGNVSIDVPTAILSIVDDDFSNGLITFSQPAYTVSERGGFATITVLRLGGSAGAASVFFSTGPGTVNPATAGADYLATNGLIQFADGQSSKSFTVPILDDTLVEGPEQILLTLSGATGSQIGSNTAVLTILADEAVFSFTDTILMVDEGAVNAIITVLRSSGGTGPVTVDFATSDGSALGGLDYVPTNGTLFFAPGQLAATFAVRILDDPLGEGNEFLTLTLATPGGEATLAGGTNVASLIILDNDTSFSFGQTFYGEFEFNPFVDVTVLRTGRSNGIVSVDFNTSDGTATAGQDYDFNSQRLVFADGETVKTVRILLRDDLIGEGDETVNLNLLNPTNGTTLGVPSTAVLIIFDDEQSLSFSSPVYFVNENGGAAVITVQRSGFFFGPASVQFSVLPGTATPGVDYTPVAGVLTFGSSEFSRDIIVPITDDALLESDETFTVVLTNASGVTALTSPSNAVVTILENDVSVAFASATFNASESASNAVITVNRLGGISGFASVTVSSTGGGSATPGVDYPAGSVTLDFFPGETSLSFLLPINDDLLIEGNETVNLVLTAPFGAALGTPSTATLTIVDDDASIIVAAGAALVSESFAPANGIIDPGETVTVNLGLRNVGNVDTANLTATLLNSNGVTGASAPRLYGALRGGGAVVSRDFTFTASGTNGGRLIANLRLQDGAASLGTVQFDFTLGRPSNPFVSPVGITIRDRSNNNGLANPYPATNIVSGLVGAVTKATVTLHNVNHTYPEDIDILLVSPTGAKCLLMSDAGGGASTANPLVNVTITFDDAAATTIPDSNQIVTATYRPANWFGTGSADTFPPPAPAGPYTNVSLAVFNGTNPNGVWLLYVVDDENGDIGNIAGGWTLNLTTTEPIASLADLSVTAEDSPDPIAAGATLTYTIRVTNNGPSVATGVLLTNVLPVGMNFIFAVTTSGSCGNAGSLVTCNLGSLVSGGGAVITILGAPTNPGTITDFVSVAGAQTDVNPANNTATIKTSVQALALRIVHEPSGCVLHWPAPASGYTLQYANALQPNAWFNYPVAPTVINGENVVPVIMTNAVRYFRLRAP